MSCAESYRNLARHATDKKSGSAVWFDRIASLQQEIEAVERKLTELVVKMKATEAAAADPGHIQRSLERLDPVWDTLTTREWEKLLLTLAPRWATTAHW